MSASSSPNSEKSRFRTRLNEPFNILRLIVCTPMGLVTGGALAAAVSQAGGLGIVAWICGYEGREPDLEAELKEASSEKFGVSFIHWALAEAQDILAKALSRSLFCVFLSFGDPRSFAGQGHDSGAQLTVRFNICRRLIWPWRLALLLCLRRGLKQADADPPAPPFLLFPRLPTIPSGTLPKRSCFSSGARA